VVHVLAKDESAPYEDVDEAGGQSDNEHFEPAHIAAADAFGRPRTVVVELFTAVVAKAAVLRVYILARDSVAFVAVLDLAVQYDAS